MKSITYLLFGLIILSPAIAFSNTLKVPSEYPTIQAGMDAANPGDTVLIADGNYTGEGNLFLSFAGKAIVVKSENGPENCIIDCVDGTGIQAFLITNGETRNSIVDGFKIINGCWVILIENSSPTVKNNVSENNNSGVYCGENSNPLVENNTILQSNENGIYCYNSTGIFRNNTVSGSHWSGIKCSWSAPTIENNTISFSYHSGINYYNSTGTIKNNTSTQNDYNGIYCNENSNPHIESNIISQNGYPGIYCQKSSPKISRNLIKENGGNSFASNGWTTYDSHNRPFEMFLSNSALHGGISINENSNPNIQNNIITGNRGFDVGAVFCDTSSVPTIVNNLITYNSSINGGSLNIKNASAKIVNNIITGAKSSDSNQRLSRWYKDNLFARYVYDGAKLDNVTYYFGFINNGEPGEVQYSGCAGFNGSVWAETGERFWVEAKSHVDTWGEGGGLNVTVSLDTSEFTIFVKREVDFIYYYCKAILSPIINSFGNANEGLAGVGIVVDNQDNMPLIAYNNVFGNPGGGYAFSDTTETKSAVQFDLTGTNGNISSDPLMNSETYELLNGSPCIDAGIADTTGLGIGETDFLGNPRFFDASAGRLAIVDIGAFEFQDNLVGIEETVIQGDEFRYSIMPNPTNGIFNFRINSEPPEKLTIKLINAQGQVLVIRSLFYPVTNQIEQFDVSHLSKGIYYFVLTTDKHRESRKIVIQ